MNAYKELEAHYQKIDDLRHIGAITGWDESAMMPAGGGAARSRAMATLNVLVHDLTVDPQISDWLMACENLELSPMQTANVAVIQREHRQAACLTSDFVRAQTEAVMASEQQWRISRAENDWATIQPHLERVVGLAREEAAMRADAGGLGLYDAMLELYEPGVTASQLDTLFEPLKTSLPPLTDAIIAHQANTPCLPLGDHFEVAAQRELGLSVMKTLGFDFNHGRLDTSHHPFCGGVAEDVRLTTRYSETDFLQSLFGVIHETGHAMYEQGRPKDWLTQPVSQALSMGTHESQSLLMEMQAGRSPAFMTFIAPKMRAAFGRAEDDPAWSVDNLYRQVTTVRRDFIRVDADEVTYPLHVILRYELEKALIDGSLTVADLPEAWHQKMTDYFGLSTAGNYKNGVMQDVHWPAGLIGYFPTYTLGALMAAQLFEAAKTSQPETLQQIETGDFTGLLSWLRQHVHNRGSAVSVDQLMTDATGLPLTTDAFLTHLHRRYLD
jgi:carboxypeptidase Taq